MKPPIILILLALSTTLGGLVHAQGQNPAAGQLSKLLAQKDSVLFDAIFTSCDVSKAENMLSKTYFFYRDQGVPGTTIAQNRADFVKRLRQRCNRARNIEDPVMRREIVTGSMQVFAVTDNEAMQMGTQRFYLTSMSKGEELVEESKFTREWRKQNGEWKIERELDYLVTTKFNNRPGKPGSLYSQIAHMDSVLFDAYNTHNIEIVKKVFDKSLEFYHDKGGLAGYDITIANLTKALAEVKDLRRELVPGSLEVYPIKDYGAVEVGLHTFCHQENGQPSCGTFKFVHVWKNTNGVWTLTRAVSFDH